MINASPLLMAKTIKNFLEVATPVPVKYGYPRGIAKDNALVTYQQSNTTTSRGIGNRVVGERITYVITVQTKTATDCLLYSTMIRRATSLTNVEFVSDSIRKDVTVKDGWINTIIVYLYTGVDITQQTYTGDEVKRALQMIADRYIFVTSMYDETLAQSFIDKFTVPELPKSTYTYDEFLSLKREYIDRLIYSTTEY